MEGFDARRALLGVQPGTPRADWPTAAVMYGLRRDLLVAPWFTEEPETRLQVLSEAVNVLGQRGFDVDSLVRYGLGDLLRRAVVAAVTAFETARYKVATDGHPVPVGFGLPEIWATMVSPSQQGAGVRAGDGAVDSARPGARIDDQLCLDDDPPLELLVAEPDELPKLDLAVAERIQFVLRRLSGDSAEAYFRQWISAAPLKHLLAWDGEPSYTMLAAPPEEVGDHYRWMVDRLTVTHFGRWRTSSLHLEWKWGNRQAEPPCRLEDMAERTIAPSELEAEIARRASVSDLSSASPTYTLDQLAGQALNLIEDGKREVAASLFEAVCAAEPESAEAQNNYGFCLLPDDPSGALDHLRLADTLAYENRAMNAVDRMQAYLLLGQPRAALRTAERILSDWDQLSPRLTAYLWSFPPTGPRLIQVRDARPIAMALAGAAAAMLGDDTEPWDKRHEHSCGELLIDCECKLTVPPSDIRRLAN